MHYQIQVSLNPEFTDLVVNEIVNSVTEYDIQKDLEYFTVYYWRVRSINSLTGQYSAWSTPCAFRVKAKDINIDHSNSYIIYGSEYFGLQHKFVTDYDTECVIPCANLDVHCMTSGDAVIGSGLCLPTSGDAVIGSGLCLPTSGVGHVGAICDGTEIVDYCPGICVPVWEDNVEYILTESNLTIQTEDGFGLFLEL